MDTGAHHPMNLIPDIVADHPQLTRWRRDIHAHPELAFEETRTAALVAEQLRAVGIDVDTGIATTGVVGTLKVGDGKGVIGLRADMDALPLDELNTFSHRSTCPGKMHGCGHDGHTVMLLGAARYLAKTRDFNGTVHFIFQPAEEGEGGARVMIEEGLFDRYPMDRVFALHNGPGAPVGSLFTRPGPFLASMDLFEVVLTGKGTHAANPHTGNDGIMVATQLINAWQTIVSRNVDPLQGAVVSVTTLQAGNSWNVIPHQVTIRGCVRTLSHEVQRLVRQRFIDLTKNIAAGFGVDVSIDYNENYPITSNDPEQTTLAMDVAAEIVGEDWIERHCPQLTGSEDFAFMLQQKPGCYAIIGNGDGEGGCMIHEPTYDFNDDIIPIGATFFARLAETLLVDE